MDNQLGLSSHAKDELFMPELETLRQRPEFREPVEPVEEHGHSNDHLALIYEDRDEQFAAAIPFIRQGLEQGERCLYVVDDASREAVLEAMRAHGIDVDAALDAGDLVLLSPAETYRRDGEFDGDAMLEFWERTHDEATDMTGYSGIRAAAEMTWALGGETDLDQLVEYEAMLNSLYEGAEYTVLCQYNRNRFPPEIIDEVIDTHPYLVQEETVSQNVYYTPPEQFFDDECPAEKVDQKLQTLQARTETKTELRDHKQYLQALYELTANGDLAFEEKVEHLLELGCERFGLDLGFLLEKDGDAFRVIKTRGTDLTEGVANVSANPDNYCKKTLTLEGPLGVEDVTEVGWEDDPLYRNYDLSCYLGTKVTDGDGVYGSVCFSSPEPKDREFTEDEYTFLDLMGQWISYELEQKHRKAELQQSKAQLQRVFESSRDAIFIVDAETDDILRVNPAACEMLGYTETQILSLGPSDLHPDELERFHAFVRDVHDDGSGWTDELTCLHEDGTRIPVEMSASHITYDGRQCMLAMVRDISDRKERERFQRQLYEVVADPEHSFEEKLRSILDIGCDHFGMEIGGLARVDPETDHFEVEMTNGDHPFLDPGEQHPLSETYCKSAVTENGTCTITNSDEFEGKLCSDQFGVQAYLGTYLEFESIENRTFWFISEEPREAFSEFERTFHHLMGQWVQYELQRQHTTDQLTALNRLNEVAREINEKLAQQSCREEIEQVVCEQLSESDSYEFAWVGTVDETTQEVVPSTSVGARGYLDEITITVDDSETAQGPTGRALQTGETQVVRDVTEPDEYEPWRDQARERQIASSAAIPIAHEDRSYGVLNIYTTRNGAFDAEERQVIGQLGEIMGLAIAATERERDLEHERERLAFINSLLRHNLLNNLNIVHARAGILEPHVDDDGREHLDVVRESVDEMADLIDTLRSLTEGLIEEDHELEPVDLGSTLRHEIEQVTHTSEDAVFDIVADLEGVPPVVADDLLGEAFQNLLVNAIQHNDKDVPRIAVDVTTTDEQVRIDVTDNGPGVPREVRDNIFEKGEKGRHSGGTGYGLHLVREIVDLYDGDVTVENTEPTGATFSVTLPRA